MTAICRHEANTSWSSTFLCDSNSKDSGKRAPVSLWRAIELSKYDCDYDFRSCETRLWQCWCWFSCWKARLKPRLTPPPSASMRLPEFLLCLKRILIPPPVNSINTIIQFHWYNHAFIWQCPQKPVICNRTNRKKWHANINGSYCKYILSGRHFTCITDHKLLLSFSLFYESCLVPPQASGCIQKWTLSLAT